MGTIIYSEANLHIIILIIIIILGRISEIQKPFYRKTSTFGRKQTPSSNLTFNIQYLCAWGDSRPVVILQWDADAWLLFSPSQSWWVIFLEP
jgi:hypothetical protein